jgi:hypothetical protein
VKIVINSDAHSVENLRFMHYGVDQARRGWLEKPHILNTLGWPQFQQWLRQQVQQLKVQQRPAYVCPECQKHGA